MYSFVFHHLLEPLLSVMKCYSTLPTRSWIMDKKRSRSSSQAWKSETEMYLLFYVGIYNILLLMLVLYKNIFMNAFVSQRNFQLLPSFYFAVWPHSVTSIPPKTETGSNDSPSNSGLKSFCFSSTMTLYLFLIAFIWILNLILERKKILNS